MFKALTLILQIGQSPNLWTQSGLGLFKLVTVVHFDYCFFSTGLIFFQGIIVLGGRGVLKVETENGSLKNNRPL